MKTATTYQDTVSGRRMTLDGGDPRRFWVLRDTVTGALYEVSNLSLKSGRFVKVSAAAVRNYDLKN